MAKRIEQWEITRYWEIFASQVPPGQNLSLYKLEGDAAKRVLQNSGLKEDQLFSVWSLADVDSDGALDFEEFCVAMRLVFDLVNGEMSTVPQQLPDWLVPEGKAHLVQAARAVSSRGETFERPQDLDDGDGEGLKDGFDWYVGPSQKREYEDIYNSARDPHGYVSFDALVDLYASLDVPDTDVHSAWNLVNPSADEVIGKDACLAFLHVLRGRHDGYRIPRTVPASLRATFERRDVEYNVDRVRNEAARGQGRFAADESTSTGRKSKFGDAYLGRLGSRNASGPKGTDFSSAPVTSDWEEVRLKKQLREIESRIDAVEAQRNSKLGLRDSTPALVKRELEQLLAYKRSELTGLETGESAAAKDGIALKAARDEIDAVREQIDGLETHLASRRAALEGIRQEIADAR